ncbi:Protein DEFECTIVE IN MERISTEM SILENCING 3 [Rhynchospora pubera]|uniref:Protein DEFECTIVE IN MERISTEM SILENCING 3 n=1 Tax=Rhynchospora pubera TaxID=906938 RepID=A0AAV8CA18_9POAL|nr:Protein DEFECTIVE IN MERISTEM SILENCING 3 [Rhynchospora pubera]
MESSSDAQVLKMKSERLEDELKKLGLKVKHHEDNLRFLKSEIDSIDEAILDKQVSLGRCNSKSPQDSTVNNLQVAEEDTLKSIMKEGGSAAALICQMKYHYSVKALKVPLMKDILGIVATLCRVNDDNLSRLLSEYLGKETMLGIVCRTYDGLKAIERYEKQGMVDVAFGLHGLGSSIGRPPQGRFTVFCLENLRPFSGDFKPDDPQKKLELHKPRLPNGEQPPGFLGFAVNMIYLDHMHLSFLTPKGHGLRETLLYTLFSRLQVYKTRSDMLHAMPCISDGAISLDGGIIRSTGLFYLGSRENVEVKFPVTDITSNLPIDIRDMEEEIKLLKWRRERLLEDRKREEILLDHVKSLFSDKKKEMMEFSAQWNLTQQPKNSQLQLVLSKPNYSS